MPRGRPGEYRWPWYLHEKSDKRSIRCKLCRTWHTKSGAGNHVLACEQKTPTERKVYRQTGHWPVYCRCGRVIAPKLKKRKS